MEHHHDRLRQLHVDKARDVDELRARIGIPRQFQGGEDVRLHQGIVNRVTREHRLLSVHLFIGDLEEEMKCVPVVDAQFLGGALALRGGFSQSALAFGIDAGVADSLAVVAEGVEEARAGFAQRRFAEGAERLFNL